MMTANIHRKSAIYAFDLEPGRVLARRYLVLSRLGGGWEGEVYKVRETNTGIERAAKLFYPQRNPNDKALRFAARKLHKLRNCPILIHYHAEEKIQVKRLPVSVLISEYIEGEILSQYLDRRRGKRIDPFLGLHLLHTLVGGMECIHKQKEYHGDIHSDNVIVRRHGLSFHVKLIDFFPRSGPRAEKIKDDICDLIRIFYDALGGARFYSKQPEQVKQICCGLKRSLILKKFRSVTALRRHLENIRWD